MINYLFKYVFKPDDRAKLTEQMEDENFDEIKEYVNHRVISAPGAVWRMFGNEICYIWPASSTLNIYLPGEEMAFIHEKQNLEISEIEETISKNHKDIDFYFNRPNRLKKARTTNSKEKILDEVDTTGMKIIEFFNQFNCTKVTNQQKQKWESDATKGKKKNHEIYLANTIIMTYKEKSKKEVQEEFLFKHRGNRRHVHGLYD